MTQKPMLRAEVYMPSIITLVQLLFFKGSPRYSDACDSGAAAVAYCFGITLRAEGIPEMTWGRTS
jgi:hypothetical protein